MTEQITITAEKLGSYVVTLPISAITVSSRFRQDMGDIAALAASIKELGLLQPIGIDRDHNLIFGERRLRAHQHLGLDNIQARIIEVPSLLQAEHDENELRKSFTPSERVAIAKAIEEELKAMERRGRPKTETGQGDLIEPENVQDFAQFEGRKSREIAAEKAGFGNPETYRQARKVTEVAVPELVEAMDCGLVSINAAALASALPDDDQREVIEEINRGAKPSEVIKKHVLATKFTGDEEWYTPVEYLASARAVLGTIDLDPASNPLAQENVQAGTYFTIDDDGLSQKWTGNVWMNPPYTARVINRFIEKLVDHYQAGDVTSAIVLTNNNTDTSWFHLGAKVASAVCFTAGRINFLKHDGSRSSPTNGQAFLFFGQNISQFADEFSKHGLVMVDAFSKDIQRAGGQA